MSFLVLMILLIALFMIGVPVAFSLFLSSLLALVLFADLPTSVVMQRMVSGVDSFPLLAIPLFVLAGELMNAGGITLRLVNFALALVGRFRGGLAQVNVGSSMMMSGVSGAAVADASALGSIMIPAMKRAGYSKDFAAAVTGSSAVVGPIIPPSIPFVVVGTVANLSVGSLFLAGAVPGVLLGLSLMVTTALLARRRGWPTSDPVPISTTLKRGADAAVGLAAPLIIVGGIVSGLFTPTEAAAVVCLYAFLVGGVLYRELTWQKLAHVLRATVSGSAAVLIIIGAAASFAYFLTLEQAPMRLLDALGPVLGSPWVLLLILNLAFLVLGAFMETIAIIILLGPILLPTVMAAGIDPIHFAVIMVLNLMIGTITPPMGVVLFIVTRISGSTVGGFLKANAWYYAVIGVVMLLVTYVPLLSTWLPSLF